MDDNVETIEPAEAIDRLIGLTGASGHEAEQALIAARGSLDLAAQFLLEGGPPPHVGHAPEARQVEAGPGYVSTTPPDPPQPHRLLAKASALGASDQLEALVSAARAGHVMQTMLDELARTQMPLMRLICEQPRSFSMLLAEDWRTQARELAQRILTHRRATVLTVRARASRSHAAATAAAIAAAMEPPGAGADAAHHDATRAHAGHRRLMISQVLHICVSLSLSVYRSIYLYLSIYQSIYQSIYLYLYLSIYLYTYIYTHIHICV